MPEEKGARLPDARTRHAKTAEWRLLQPGQDVSLEGWGTESPPARRAQASVPSGDCCSSGRARRLRPAAPGPAPLPSRPDSPPPPASPAGGTATARALPEHRTRLAEPPHPPGGLGAAPEPPPDTARQRRGQPRPRTPAPRPARPGRQKDTEDGALPGLQHVERGDQQVLVVQPRHLLPRRAQRHGAPPPASSPTAGPGRAETGAVQRGPPSPGPALGPAPRPAARRRRGLWGWLPEWGRRAGTRTAFSALPAERWHRARSDSITRLTLKLVTSRPEPHRGDGGATYFLASCLIWIDVLGITEEPKPVLGRA